MSDEHQQQQHQQQQRQQLQHNAVTHLQAHNNNNSNNNHHNKNSSNNSNDKISKDNSSASNNSSTESQSTNSTPPRKSNIHEMRNQEFVSRLMAATPPYLYSAPVGPNNFFFSDMLRSLVQARNNETARNLQMQQQAALARRPRKRTWSQPHRAFYEQNLRERKEAEEQRKHLANNPIIQPPNHNEKPLELTTNKPFYNAIAQKYRKFDETPKELSQKQEVRLGNNLKPTIPVESATPANDRHAEGAMPMATNLTGGGAVDATLQNNTPPAASLPPQDLVLPPPPPVWYPPLYPPYGIDPLHFFIDLRVSGHIYDRKKENVSPLPGGGENSTANTENETTSSNPPAIILPNKHRHGSAFTVPVPRSNEHKSNGLGLPTPNDAINLSSNPMANKFSPYAKYYDLGESKENQPFMKANAGANYMLQHLPRLYSQFAARDLIGHHMEQSILNNNNNNNSDNNNLDNSDNIDNKSEEADCDADSSDDRVSNDAVDVEIIDSIKYRNSDDANDGDSSRCSSGDDGASITQID